MTGRPKPGAGSRGWRAIGRARDAHPAFAEQGLARQGWRTLRRRQDGVSAKGRPDTSERQTGGS